jgi:hypothetical protein
MTTTDDARLRLRRYHEAGHACVATAFHRELDVVTVASCERWAGLTVHRQRARPNAPPAPPEVVAAHRAHLAELAQLQAEIAELDAADPAGAPPPPVLLFQPPEHRARIEAEVVALLAGYAAEDLLLTAGVYRGDRPDEIKAERLALELATTSPRHAELIAAHAELAGGSDMEKALTLSTTLAGPEAMAHLGMMRAVTWRMVAERWPQVEALADALRLHPILDGAAAEAIIEEARTGRKEI